MAIGAQNAFVLRQGLRHERVALVVAICPLSDIVLIFAGVAGIGVLAGEVSAKDQAFYEGKVAAAQFFAQTNLPRLTAERAIAEATDLSLMDLDESAF